MSGASKRKRQKLVELIAGSSASWSSKACHQASQLMKLNKILLVCDANFLDEKTGESPLSLAIGSKQLAQATLSSLQQQNGQTINMQSASLFSLQSQHQLTNSIDSSMLRQTNIADLYHSRAPLIERLILMLVKSGAQIDFRNSDKRTPLHVAAMKSNFWALKTLLDLGASNDYRDINGLTPLYYSILYKADLKVTQLLLNHNRSLNAGYHSTPNHLASVGNGKSPAIGIVDQHGWQEVHQACKLGLDAHLEKLLYYGCDIDAKISGSGNTPLHVAAINDQLNCAKVLLMRGANKTITNNSHQTAHQVAVISNNMDLAEFIAEHNESKVIPFTYDIAARRSTAASGTTTTTTNSTTNSSTRSSSLANSQSSISISGHQQHHRAVLPVYPQQQQKPTMMIPLSLDVAQGLGGEGVGSISSNASQTCSSINSSQPQSLLSIGSTNQLAIGSHQQQLNVQVNNISPCLSQRSCATSNTTSSSGVCCDGDGTNSVDDHHNHHHHQQHQHNHQQAPAPPQVKLANSQSQHSNITVISINNAKTNNRGALVDEMDASAGHVEQQQQHANNNNDPDEEDDSRSSGSCSGGSSQGLYSIMSEERPLFVGSIVEAASDYRSGDPSHLQLKRGDRIEVLEYTSDLLQSGQMPRLANKPMLFGRRLADGQSGLFPSFCVHRTKYQSAAGLRQKLPLANITAANNTINHHQQSMHMATPSQQEHTQPQQIGQNIRGNSLAQSRSMASLAIGNNNNNGKPLVVQPQTVAEENPLKLKFKEIQVTLIKGPNEGFGFILRGAKINPATLNGSNSGVLQNKLVIDENLMAANNLVSLQYLDDIEPGSVAQKAGLKRGDFLVAVNGQDVRLFSHEQVVQKIVQSGEQVHLTIATPIILNSSPAGHVTRTCSQKVKPEPPKRDPNTTLTRNKTQRAKSMLIQPIGSSQRPRLLPDLFDANKPLPMAPSSEASGASPTGSLNIMARSVSAHFHSSQSLSSSAATDTQSISSVSTISADQQHQPPPQPHHLQQHQQQILPLQLQENTTSSLSSQQVTPTHSSSSTATLTTVAAVKPVAPPKPKFSATNNIYQPATITTSKRTSPTSPPKTAQVPPMAQVPTHQQAAQPPPPPPLSTTSWSNSTAPVPQPPPPPPLPDFSAKTPELSRSSLSQRRTSAPITPSLISDVNRLLKKRESLAFISNKPTVVPTTTATAAPAQFGAVAAACAAAANSRLQRQQQKLEEQQQNQSIVGDSGGIPAESNKLEEERTEGVNTIATDQADLQSGATTEREFRTVESKRLTQEEPVGKESGAKVVVEQKQQRQINQLHHKQQIVADHVGDDPICVHQKQRPSIVDELAQKHQHHHQHLSRHQASATLGRKSSAQIIQQPKQASGQLHQHSQTLRAKPTHQRPSLPQYDEMLPPPPPPLLDESWRRSSDAEHLISQAQQQAAKLAYQRPHQHHDQQHHQHQHHNQVPVVECQQQQPQAIYRSDVQALAQQHQKRQSQELIYQQQQQLYLLQQQQQLIKQQRLQQQQIKLQHQLQQQHRLCLDSLSHEHHHGHALALDHHHLQQQRRCIDAESTARSHHHHHHHHNHNHNHHDHHLHDHYQTQMAPQQQPAQALLVQPCVVASSARLTSASQHQVHAQPNHYNQHQVLQQQQQQYHLHNHNHHQPQQQQQHQQLLLQSQRNHHHHRHHQHYS